jgi:hypothetical protein
MGKMINEVMRTKRLVENINNLKENNSIDPRQMIASMGWEATSGILDEPYVWEEDEEFENWMKTMGPQVINPEEGIKQVLEYAESYGLGATPEELQDLKTQLLNMVSEYQGHTFFLYGIETDLSLGVL